MAEVPCNFFWRRVYRHQQSCQLRRTPRQMSHSSKSLPVGPGQRAACSGAIRMQDGIRHLNPTQEPEHNLVNVRPDKQSTTSPTSYAKLQGRIGHDKAHALSTHRLQACTAAISKTPIFAQKRTPDGRCQFMSYCWDGLRTPRVGLRPPAATSPSNRQAPCRVCSSCTEFAV